jgi:hypothetical protein
VKINPHGLKLYHVSTVGTITAEPGNGSPTREFVRVADAAEGILLAPEHEAQLLNYLKATTYEVGLLLNFGPRLRSSAKSTTTSAKAILLGLKDRTQINTDKKEKNLCSSVRVALQLTVVSS